MKLKILIAEDDETSGMLLTELVEVYGREFKYAATGLEAVEVCRNNPDLDLVLMDVQMPKMNGYDATRHIRQFNKNVVIIAQTAFALSGEREKAMSAGCTDYISKPINQSTLISLVKKYFN
jgi:CheY-like chemotaxis protein